MPSPGDITVLLRDLENGSPDAAAKLMPLVYEHLRRMANRHFRHERRGHTLQPTALVHEAYVQLVKPGAGPWKRREHFYAVAATAMRHILVDYARARKAGIRGGRLERVDFDKTYTAKWSGLAAVTELDVALKKLEALDRRKVRVVELRFFAGLTVRETAAVLGVGVTTVKEDWALAKAWLQRELTTA